MTLIQSVVTWFVIFFFVGFGITELWKFLDKKKSKGGKQEWQDIPKNRYQKWMMEQRNQ